jgi:hypothetical protein
VGDGQLLGVAHLLGCAASRNVRLLIARRTLMTFNRGRAGRFAVALRLVHSVPDVTCCALSSACSGVGGPSYLTGGA